VSNAGQSSQISKMMMMITARTPPPMYIASSFPVGPLLLVGPTALLLVGPTA
jgi:hypothetical protein